MAGEPQAHGSMRDVLLWGEESMRELAAWQAARDERRRGRRAAACVWVALWLVVPLPASLSVVVGGPAAFVVGVMWSIVLLGVVLGAWRRWKESGR
jgi:hypothetical protein